MDGSDLEFAEREQRYRMLFDGNPHALWVYDLETLAFLDVNDAAVARYGYSRDEFLAMTIRDIRPASEWARFEANIAQSAPGLERSGAWTHRLKNGELIQVAIDSHDLMFEGRRARLVHANDVTALIRADRERETLMAELRSMHAETLASRDLLNTVFERIADGFIALDREGRFSYVNRKGAELLGEPDRERWIGRKLEDDGPAAGGAARPCPETLRQAMLSLEPRSFEAYDAQRDLWIESRIYPSPDGVSIYLSDITQRKRADDLLRQSEQRLRHFFDSGLGGMAITTPDKHWGQINRRLCEMLGYSAEQLREMSWAELTHPDDLAADVAHFERVLSGSINGYRMDKRFIRADGSELQAEISVRVERNAEGRAERFFAIVEDIGARKQAEAALSRHRDELERQVTARTLELVGARDEAERANRAKSAFLSRMSHELRTPLNAILGFGQLLDLERATLEPKHREYVQEMLRAGRHLLTLINDALDLASVEAGNVPLSLEPLAVAELLAEAIAMVRPLADARRVQLAIDDAADAADAADADSFVSVRADRIRLRQVLLNLLSNAVKYNREHGDVHIRVQKLAERVRIEVHDTGPGIAVERQDELFQPFQRLGAEFGTVEGTGIGLTIARQLIELMAGRIGFRSQPGAGSCFWIDLPAAARETHGESRSMLGRADGIAAASDAAPGVLTVLCVDDNPANLRLLQQMLARHPSVRCLAASTAGTALALARQEQPDLMLLDIHLPDRDGYTLLAELRTDPATREIPAVAVTAHAMPDDERRARDAGFIDHLSKPIDIARLDGIVRRLMAMARA